MQIHQQNERLISVDVLRGIASLGVCIYHVNNHVFLSAPKGIIRSLFLVLGFIGGAGVDMFFVISGFIIPYTLYKADYRISYYLRFILKRIIRLDPPYIFSIGFVLLLFFIRSIRRDYEFVIDPMQLILHVGYLCKVFGYEWLNPVYWSLSVEILYYLIIGLLFTLVSSRKKL